MKKYIVLFILLILPILSSCTANLEGETKYITEFYKKQEISSFWDVAALCYAGADMSHYNITPFLSANPAEDDYSGISGRVIGLKMLENSGYDISGYDLDGWVKKLELMTENDDASGFSLPILQRLYGIYALKLADANYSEDNIERYARHILSFQLEDGGFSTFSSSGDVDTTAFVIPLLVYMREKEGFEKAVAKASVFLRSAKNKDDTYSSFATPNSNTTASALSALMALGFTEKDDDIGDISLALATFRLADGSYSYEKYGNTNLLSCAQALIAYRDFSNKSSLWLSILENQLVKSVTLSITGIDNSICQNETIIFGNNDTAFDIFANYCRDNNIVYTHKNKYITSVNGVAEFDHGPESGWVYTVNGERASVGCASYKLQNGDVIEFKYITEYEDNI